MVLRKLSEEEMTIYAAPYPSVRSRKPLLAWPKDVPFKDGKVTRVTSAVQSWAAWLAESKIPKLCFYVTPGVAIKEKDVNRIKENFQNTKIIYLGEGLHFIQEDYPHEIGQGISEWYSQISES